MFTISNEIKLPGLATSSSLLTIGSPSGSYGTYNDPGNYLIDPSNALIEFLARQIVIEELSYIARTNPEYDMEKLQTMLDSYDIEMNQLAFTWFEKNTLYTRRILPSLKAGNRYTLEEAIHSYITFNKLNITGKLR